MTIMEAPAWTLASAIEGLPITIVPTRSGSLTNLAWSRTTAISAAVALAGPARAAMPNAHAKGNLRIAAPQRRKRNTITHSRTLRLGQPTSGAEWAGLAWTSPHNGKRIAKACARRASPEKRVDQLGTETRREFAVGDAIGGRHRILGHVISAEQNIEDRERRGEVLLAALLGCGVMPAVEDRARKHVAEWAQRPIEIGMYEGGVRDRKRAQEHQHVR